MATQREHTRPSAGVALRVLRRTRRAATRLVAVLPASLLVAASLFAALHAMGFAPRLITAAPTLLPVDPDLSQRLAAAATAIGLAGVAAGLARHKQVAWWVAVAALGAALPVQAGLLRHGPAAFLAAACLAVLVADRGRYRVETAGRSSRVALLLWVTGLVTATAAIGLAAAATLRLAGLPMDARAAGDGMLSWTAFGNPVVGFPRWHEPALVMAGTLAARIVAVVGIIAALAPGDFAREDLGARAHADEVAARYGQGALLPFQLGPDTRRFSLPGRNGVLSYARSGRVAVVLGDPIGPAPEAELVFHAFVRDCVRHDWSPAVYQASAGAVHPLQAAGFVAYRIGREAVVDLGSFTLAGSNRANLRHAVARAARGGVTVRWYPRGLGAEAAAINQELAAVDETWHRAHGPRMQFTVGAYQPSDLVENPVAIARDAHGAVVAFTTFRATGADGGWVLNLLRRVPDCIPGAVEACLVAAAEGLRADHAATLSLGLAPLSGLDPGRGPLVERLLAVGTRLARRVYDVDGLAFFKGKFDPRWEPRYLAVRHRRQVASVLLALARLHLGGSRGLIRFRPHLRPSLIR
jgi:phosphatidylglycerol lysyltransferase